MSLSSSTEQWFALRVKSNREKVSAASLAGKGYESFLPLVRLAGSRANSEKRPLFPGYLFCRFDPRNRLPILMLPGVVHIVGIGKLPVPVDEEELESLRVLVAAGLPINPDEQFTIGQKVRIEQGPLSGAGGVIVGVRDQRLVVSITLLQRSVSVVLHRDWVAQGLLRTVAAGNHQRGAVESSAAGAKA